MARPVLQTTGSIGVSYIIFRGIKQLLSKHVPEEWIEIEKQQKNKVDTLVQKLSNVVDEQLRVTDQEKQGMNSLYRIFYSTVEQIRINEILLYIVTIIVIIILPPLLAIYMKNKRDEALKTMENRNRDDDTNNGFSHESRSGNSTETKVLQASETENSQNDEDYSVEDQEQKQDEREQDTFHTTKEIKNFETNKPIDFSLRSIKQTEPEANKEGRENLDSDTDEIQEETEDIKSNRLNDQKQEQEREEIGMNHNGTVDEIDIEDGFQKLDKIISPLEADVYDVSKDQLETQIKESDVEKENLEPEQTIVLEKPSEPREIPDSTFHTDFYTDSHSSLHSPKLLHSGASSYIQFSPSKSSDLSVEIDKRNAYSQPFEY